MRRLVKGVTEGTLVRILVRDITEETLVRVVTEGILVRGHY